MENVFQMSRGSFWILLLLFVLGNGSANAAICSAPGTHPTAQAAVNDPTCDTVNLADQTYPESILIERSLTLSGPAQIAEIDGLLEVRGSGVNVNLANLFIESGCQPGSLVVTGGAKTVNVAVEARNTAGAACPALGIFFSDGFETGNTTSWTQTVP